MEELDWLKTYAREHSQESFARIVQRYIDVVYAAARRQVRDEALAEDVTQAVFIVMAQKAASIPTDRPLSAWLLKTTSYCAANARRARDNRESHERRAAEMARMNRNPSDDESAWEELSPLLDEGLNKLRAADRDALLLKFFEKKSLRQIGDAFGISEEAAGKRVARAVEKLRDFFRRRGAVVSAAALGTILISQSAQAAPAALAASVTSAAATTAASATSAGAVAKGAIGIMAAEKAKAAVISIALMTACVGGAAVAVKTVIGSSASGTRTITVATAPAATTPTASIAEEKLPQGWEVKFPSGRIFEVIGITENTPAGRWWHVDGSPCAGAKVDFAMTNALPRPPRTRQVHIVVRSSLPPDERWMFALKDESFIRGSHRFTANSRLHLLTSTMPADVSRGDLTLGCGYGPWDVEVNCDVEPMPNAKLPHGAPRILKVTSTKTTCVIRTETPAYKSDLPLDEQFVLVKLNGEVVESTNRLFQPAYREYTFPIPAEAANYSTYRRRPYEIVELRNIALKPDVKTEPMVVTVFERKVEATASGK